MTLEASLFVIKFLNPSIPKDVCLMWSFLEHILSFGIRSCPRCLTDMFGPVSFYLLDSCFQYFQIVNHKKFSTGRLNIYSFFWSLLTENFFLAVCHGLLRAASSGLSKLSCFNFLLQQNTFLHSGPS